MKENTKLIESGPNSKTSLSKWPVVRVGHFVKIPFQFSLQNSLFFDTKLLKVNRQLRPTPRVHRMSQCYRVKKYTEERQGPTLF